LPLLLSSYTSDRDPGGHLVISAPMATGPALGCAVPAVGGAVVAWLIGAAGVGALVLVFAVFVLATLLYNGSRRWIVTKGSVQELIVFAGRRLRARPVQQVGALVVRREVWRGGRGSTDSVLIRTAGDKVMRVLEVHNWLGRESRLANGGRGSLARSGTLVPRAAEPLKKSADSTLLPATSECVSEMAELLRRELNVPLRFEAAETFNRPRGRI
jgi:hypothetical protein